MGDEIYAIQGPKIRVINALTAQYREIDVGCTDDITDICFSRSKQRLFIASTSQPPRGFDLKTREVKVFSHPEETAHAIIEGEEGYVYTTCNSGSCKLIKWDYHTGEIIHMVPDWMYNALAMLYDVKTNRLFTDHTEGGIACRHGDSLDVIDRNCIDITSPYRMLRLNETTFAVESSYGELSVWDIESFTMIRKLDHCYDSACFLSVSDTPDKRVVIGILMDNNSICQWNWDKDSTITRLSFTENAIYVALSENGEIIATVGIYNEIRIIRVISGWKPPIYTGSLSASMHGIACRDYDLYVNDALIKPVPSGESYTPPLLLLMAKSTVVRISPLEFAISGEYEAAVYTRDINGVRKTTFEARYPSEATAWVNAINAVIYNLSFNKEDQLKDPEHVMGRYLFDHFQLINRQNGGRGLLPNKTIPKTVIEMIGFYTFLKK